MPFVYRPTAVLWGAGVGGKEREGAKQGLKRVGRRGKREQEEGGSDKGGGTGRAGGGLDITTTLLELCQTCTDPQ